MASQRPRGSSNASGPHSVSLKVLRLSRPSLATHTPLPSTSFGNGLDIPQAASLAYPSADAKSTFPLTPLLTLPAAFGAAYVGESFACTLCANNELQPEDAKKVSGVRITAELQTPSNPTGTALELSAGGEEDDGNDGELGAGKTLQRTIRHALKEEGAHVLAVTVTYTETLHDEEAGGASGGRARTFRKLYQFVAQALIAVRSKVTEMKHGQSENARRWIIEAQLENVGESSVTLEKYALEQQDGLNGTAISVREDKGGVVLKARDVEQVMFVVNETSEQADKTVGKRQLGQLRVDWRGAMGEPGSLSTGWLTSRS